MNRAIAPSLVSIYSFLLFVFLRNDRLFRLIKLNIHPLLALKSVSPYTCCTISRPFIFSHRAETARPSLRLSLNAVSNKRSISGYPSLDGLELSKRAVFCSPAALIYLVRLSEPFAERALVKLVIHAKTVLAENCCP